jgi:hypothetical protein
MGQNIPETEMSPAHVVYTINENLNTRNVFLFYRMFQNVNMFKRKGLTERIKKQTRRNYYVK